jgi:ribosomal-protein-alanine N-acetyltransferase
VERKTDVIYRPMVLDDIPQVQLVERKCFTTPWSRSVFLSELMRNDNAFYVVAQLDERIIGYAGVWIILDEGHITNIAVDPSYQRGGVGQRLMEEITVYAVSRGVTKMTLEVRVSNLGAQALYKKMGYVSFGVRKRYYQDNNEDAFIMWRELTNDAERTNIRDRDEL